MAVLVLNPGSTTLKAAIVSDDGTILSHSTLETWDLGQAAHTVLDALDVEISSIGCRVVHGGRQFSKPTLVTDEVIQAIQDLGELAPLHNYGAAAVLRTCMERLPQIPIIAVFDTAFHRTIPAVAHQYALPPDITEREGLYRYGFHGIVHQATSRTLTEKLREIGHATARVITCHLGGGASACAIKDGQSVDTSMGFSPLEGLVMATRTGTIDAGILLHLLKKGWDHDSLEHLLNTESGLLGVSGLSTDPRVLLAASDQGNERAKLAMELYTYRVAKEIAALTVPLGGLDALAFSGGIGQNSATTREMICNQLNHLGIILDQASDYAGEPTAPRCISPASSAVSVWTIPSMEELVIAQLLTEA